MVADGRTVGQKLFAGMGVLLALTVIEGGVALWGSARVETGVSLVAERSLELQRTLAIHTALFKIESSVKSMLWAGLDNDRDSYAAAKDTGVKEFAKAGKELEALTGQLTTESDRALARTLGGQLKQWETLHGQIIQLADAGNIAEALQIVTTKADPLFNDAEATAQSIAAEMFKATADASQALEQSRARAVTAIVIVLALIVGGVVAWIVRSINGSLRDMSRELGEGARHVVDASSQMAVSAQSMSQGASEQAASLEETSASMEEISAMTRTNADNSQQAATLMGEAARVLDQSNRSLADMVTAMTSITESSNSVSKIIKTIDEIAFQTNILALNAAVEAARAGEAGMGFAVVADEVRSLAQRSAQAARDTTVLIEGAIASSGEGGRKVAQAAESFTAITERVTEVKRLVDNVSVASGQQAHGIEQVLQTIRQMERLTQTTAATAEESAAASEQLNAQADGTMKLVRRLEAMVDQVQSEAPSARVRPSGARAGARVTPLIPAGTRPIRHGAERDDRAGIPGSGTFGRF